jgi:hypothetical protein
MLTVLTAMVHEDVAGPAFAESVRLDRDAQTVFASLIAAM